MPVSSRASLRGGSKPRRARLGAQEIDGRVVLPKPIRERLGLQAGGALELEETPGRLVLERAGQKAALVQKHGLWVHTGDLPADYDIL